MGFLIQAAVLAKAQRSRRMNSRYGAIYFSKTVIRYYAAWANGAVLAV
jgi:hypothetical protein